jgi:hydroxymethylpyrimidine/phosphomethylpyrimidine kinase
MKGRVLIVAGSDSGGGAGIQADIKTVTALGGYAAAAITAVTAQDTETVHVTLVLPAALVRRQMEVVLDDIGADAIKTGMLCNREIIATVAKVLMKYARNIPLVVDPVMTAKGGAVLLEPAASQTFKAELVVQATVLTPNLPEAEFLTGMKIAGPEDMAHAAAMLQTLGPEAVLLKGGHLPGDTVRDYLATMNGVEVFVSPRLQGRSTHGTGCTLASAIATGLAQGLSIRDAIARARVFVFEAIRAAPGYGSGHGPLNHGFGIAPLNLEASLFTSAD